MATITIGLPDFAWGALPRRPPRPANEQTLSDTEVRQVVAGLARGDDQHRNAMLAWLQTVRPLNLSAALLPLADDKGAESPSHTIDGIIALGLIGDAVAVRGLLKLSHFDERGAAVCYALGLSGDTSAAKHLLDKIKMDSPFLALMKERLYLLRAYALMGLAVLGHPAPIPALVQGAKDEMSSTLYMQDFGSFGGGGLGLALTLVSVAASGHAAARLAARTAAVAVAAHAPFSSTWDLPGVVRLGWMLRLRIAALESLASHSDPQYVLACWPQARHSIQRLVLAVSLLPFMPPASPWINALAESARSRAEIERLLAYDGFVRLAQQNSDPNAIQWVAQGLQDREQRVRTALASEILLRHVTPLIPQALEFARAPAKDVRLAMVPALAVLALAGDAQGQAALNALAALEQDKDRDVREASAALKEESHKMGCAEILIALRRAQMQRLQLDINKISPM